VLFRCSQLWASQAAEESPFPSLLCPWSGNFRHFGPFRRSFLSLFFRSLFSPWVKLISATCLASAAKGVPFQNDQMAGRIEYFSKL
jgi:hypothetical protein